ncbi:pentapeptide repeat-containing protein [Nakamurella lactea]|uniref:pentapeptide repeat-containing protein n=1 Tax=Nakamurella lactea TaxID=459515 RepID=UPI00048C0AC7|nr:pentapeptide repeat-containing protein [Nakamurella lactea]
MYELEELRADCSRCVAWCCVAPAFGRSADFAFDKPAGLPCKNLLADFRCSIHATLRADGMKGCTSFDCFGAGQKVTQQTLAGRSWRDDPAGASEMFAVFHAMRDLHEILWYLTVVRRTPLAAPLWSEIDETAEQLEELTRQPSGVLAALDTLSLNSHVTPLLDAVSDLVRAADGNDDNPAPGRDLSGRDLAGADLRGTPLRRARLRGAMLIAADLRGVDLSRADLLGAHLRDARLDDADLTDALFLNQLQLNGANGNSRTRVPWSLLRPGHWVDAAPE